MFFENDEEGYIEAVKWLKENELYPTCLKYELSTDGWTVIACANSLLEKMNEENERKT